MFSRDSCHIVRHSLSLHVTQLSFYGRAGRCARLTTLLRWFILQDAGDAETSSLRTNDRLRRRSGQPTAVSAVPRLVLLSDARILPTLDLMDVHGVLAVSSADQQLGF